MPCRDEGPDPAWEREQERRKRLEEIEHMNIELMEKLEREDRLDVAPDGLMSWWYKRKEELAEKRRREEQWERERPERERKERERRAEEKKREDKYWALRKSGLAKLTPEERKALHIRLKSRKRDSFY